jgi:hypothetical protein
MKTTVEVIEILEKYKTVHGYNTKVIAKTDNKTFEYLFINEKDVINVGYTWDMGCKPIFKK